MPMEQIYVLELILYEIILYPSYTLKDINELGLSFKFAQRINFDIDTRFFTGPQIQATTKGSKILMNYGKTFLFTSKPSILRQLLLSDPFIITLYDGNTTIGQVQVPWKKEFAEMVKFFESLGIVKSTTFEDWHELKQNDKAIAKVNVFIRMSCFGSNVQTMFQIKRDGSKHNYFFRQRNESKIFKVEKHADDRIQPLVAPLYAGMTEGVSKSSQFNMKENVSLTELFAAAMDDKSIYQGVEDAVSMCYRPSENRFFNLLTLISADVKTHDKGTCVTIQRSRGDHGYRAGNVDNLETLNFQELTADKISRKLCGNSDCPAVKKFKEYGIGPLATGKNLGTLYNNDVEPPVTYGLSHMYGTFREYGPYGVFSRPKDETLPFVPLDKRKNQSSKSCGKASKPDKIWHSKGCPLRLRGGSDPGIENKIAESSSRDVLAPKSPMIECKSVMDQFDSILAEYKKAIGPCRQATCPFAQTLAEDACKKACNGNKPPPIKEPSLMSCNNDPCDLEECPYPDPKKKRYPAGCGSPKCAYTKYKLGLLDDDAELELQFLPPALGRNCGDPHCKYPFEPPLPPIHWDCPEPLPKGPCKNMNCPFLPAPLKKFKTKGLNKGPCGSPTCPYSLPGPCPVPTCPFALQPCPINENQSKQQKCPKCLDTTSSDDDSLCDNPECPYVTKNATKEIQDQISDPKFKGEFQDCGNPQCPYKMAESTKQSKKKKKSKKKKDHKSKSNGLNANSCKNPSCPYALPNPCSLPTCPFAVKHCPLAEMKQKQMCPECSSVSTSSIGDNINKNGRCSKKTVNNEYKKQTNDSKLKNESQDCGNPECPYAMKQNSKKTKKKKRNEQTSQSNSSKMDSCNNPSCPFAKLAPDCPMPMCPFTLASTMEKKPTQQSRCSETSSDTDSGCGNPKCPFTKKKSTKPKQPKNQMGENGTGQCQNPECPFSKQTDAKQKGRGQEQRSEICDSSDCQKAESKDKKEKEADVDESSICSNPDCTYAELKGNKKKQSSSESVCSNPECPYADYRKMKLKENQDDKKNEDSFPQDQDSVCSNEECPKKKPRKQKKRKEKLCIQPSCPYSKKKSKKSPCVDPLCPYLQPLPSCGIPNCPYEPIPIRFSCKDPNCPSKSINFNKTIRTKTENLQTEETSKQEPINTTTTTYEETMVCIKDNPCDNPDCDMQAVMEAMGDASYPVTESRRTKMRKKGKFVYSIGDEYPGTKAGHKECMVPVFKVPPNMGWLWNIYTPVLGLKPRRGWRPGALTRSIAQRIREHRHAKGLGMLAVPNFRKGGNNSDAELEPKVTPRPTLQIQKRENAYWITMNPLKDPLTLAENEDPYMDCTPMTFKITKNTKEEYCVCDGDEPIEESTSSSDSELDIEFTPPAGIIHPERYKKKPNVASCEAQYDPKDVTPDKAADKKKGDKKEGKGKDKKGKDKKGKEKGDKGDEKKSKGGKGGKGDEKKDKGGKDKDDKGKEKKGKDKKDDKKKKGK